VIDRSAAEKKIKSIFSKYKALAPTDTRLIRKLKDGKLYELFVLSEIVAELKRRGCILKFKGSSLQFKGAPGHIKLADPHFEIATPHGPPMWLFVDIEFATLGSAKSGSSDLSGTHELDIVVVTAPNAIPAHWEIALAVECKCVATFEKKIIKEALGVRRELSLLMPEQPTILSCAGATPYQKVPADPPSEFILAYIDAAGDKYKASPRAFGIELRHMEP
jgi:hypothetical protein